MTGLLEGRTAIVTGASKGIGLAITARFAAQGAHVVLAARGHDALDAAVGRIVDAGGSAVAVTADVTDEASVAALVDAAVERFGGLDVMVNNAGSTGDPSPLTELSASGFDHTFQLDARSVVFGHKHAARRFREQGDGGSIITIASVAAIQGGWSSISYTTAKHAVIGTVRHAAKELSADRIRTNVIAPGVIMTPLIADAFGVPSDHASDLMDVVDERLGTRQALGRYGTVDDIANVALFLASDLSSYVSGAVIPVDGGISAYTQSTSDDDIARVAREFLDRL